MYAAGRGGVREKEMYAEDENDIVRGMSGSPIIQDGKLVGAVTHVLVNQPDTGYGIFIENMLDAAGKTKDRSKIAPVFFCVPVI